MDDDEDDREIFCLAVEACEAPIACVPVRDGLEALTALDNKSFTPDYIFLDLNMPIMDGKQCLKAIRNLRHLDNVPVIIFSTSSSEKDKEETRALGANAFITKPPLVSTLAKKLSDIFNNQYHQADRIR